MKKVFRLILINFAVLATLLFLINILCLILIKSEDGNPYPYKNARRSELNNNEKDSAYNRLVYDEFYKLTTIYQPYVVWSRNPFKGQTTTIDSTGDRVTPNNPINSSDIETRVHFFGGSTMWGTGVDDLGTIPSFYQQKNPNHLSLNHGESGFVSRQNLARLINLVNQDIDIDRVVFYDGFNDILTLCRSEVDINSHDRAVQINQYINDAQEIKSSKHLIMKVLDVVFVRNIRGYFLSKKSSTLSPNEFYSCCSDSMKVQQVANTLVNNWRIAHAICTARNIEFHAILQPSAYVGNPTFDPRFDQSRNDCIPDVSKRFTRWLETI